MNSILTLKLAVRAAAGAWGSYYYPPEAGTS
jgi:hypothetical protein